MCLNSPTLSFLPCFITFCSTHSYTNYFYEIFATCIIESTRSRARFARPLLVHEIIVSLVAKYNWMKAGVGGVNGGWGRTTNE